ncbi:hypothetical protein GCM10009850_116530 [Nonomuraea monospora]|uniref:UspA domain-containing protein n=1 Tax=Nonomuraea monospora TaxID=568818 RepID=A0ABN3D2X2_9ACTN
MAGHIVVAVDRSAAAMAAVAWAADDARRRNLGLRIVHVHEQRPGEHPRGCCASTLTSAADLARGTADGIQVSTELLAGTVVDRLLEESGTADTMVLGSRGLGGLAGMLAGSVSLAMAGHARGPVVVVRGPESTRHGCVVVGYDNSSGNYVS